MIDHAEARRRSSLDLDGELEPELVAELRAHLDGCADCTRRAATLAELRRHLRDDETPAPDVSAGVLAAITAAKPVVISTTPRVGDQRAEGSPSGSGRGDDGDSDGRIAALHVVGHHVAEPSPNHRATTSTTVVERGDAHRWLPAVACLVVGVVIGSVLVGGLRGPSDPAAAQVPERVAAAQFAVDSLSSRIEIHERGWHAAVPARTFSGTIDYQAPDRLGLHLEDTTTYPTDAWVPNDVDVVRTADQWWTRGPRDCPGAAQPGCAAPEPRLVVIDDTGPFSDAAPVPLDLVVPVRSFQRSPEPPPLGTRTIDGREAVGVEVTAAQLSPLLDGLRPAGNLRQLFAADEVDLWLDATSWTPLRIEVRASADPDRRTWAIDHGYVDQPGDAILTVELRDVRVNEGVDADRIGPAPEGGVRRNAGFVPLADEGTAADVLPVANRGVTVDPSAVPEGLAPWTTGAFGVGTDHETVVQTWFGGRGWLSITSTTTWDGTALFGDLGSPVRRTVAPDGSVVYANLDGTRLGVHANGIDLVVAGSLDADALARVVAGIGITGETVPEDWRDAATETIASASDLLPGLLVPVADPGFEPAAVRADGNVVTQAYAGAGSRGFVVVEAPGERLTPPLDMAVTGVRVRGVDGRYSATRGELEWVEGERILRITSSTLSRAELLAIAESMVPA